MKIMFDTNVYISWIRDGKYPELLLNRNTLKYISSIVLMELWAGARTKKASHVIEKLQQIYLKTNRVVTLDINHYITIGKIISDLPAELKSKIQMAGFINDLQIGVSAYSIGATLFTENKNDFVLIESYIRGLKVCYL
ncbi:type II toxin-antitoxin system VapC family toxin [Candidatus Poribacteria bacterium]|nr:type II toxin-antitoxin system VapC family toxin [Candidatus Poribacteria bacterium]